MAKSGKSKAKSSKKAAPAIEIKPYRKVEVLDAEDDLDSDSAEPVDAPEESEETLPVVYNAYDPKVLETAEKTLVPSDPLKRYLQEIKNAPVLTAEQEQALAKRMQEKGDVNAAKLLVSANLRNVVRIAYEYRSMYHNLLDLIQEGNIGLMKAVSKFDPTKGVRLGYYATWWIRSYILKYLLDNFRLVRVGTSQAQKKLFYHLMREKQRLEALGIQAGPALIAQNLDVKEKDVIEMEQRLLSPKAEVSIDAPSPQNPDFPGSTLLNTLFDPGESVDLKLERDAWLKILEKEIPLFMQELNEKERMVLMARLLAEDPKTLQEVADDFGLTRERVRQIETKLIEKLRKRLEIHLK